MHMSRHEAKLIYCEISKKRQTGRSLCNGHTILPAADAAQRAGWQLQDLQHSKAPAAASVVP